MIRTSSLFVEYPKGLSRSLHALNTVMYGPLYRKTKRGHYAAFGPAVSGRLLVIVFEVKGKGLVRPITGWDMTTAERRYYQAHRGG